MSRNLSTKYYQENKKKNTKEQRKLVEDIKVFLKKKKKKKQQYGRGRYKNLLVNENNKLFEYRNGDIEREKTLYYSYKIIRRNF